MHDSPRKNQNLLLILDSPILPKTEFMKAENSAMQGIKV